MMALARRLSYVRPLRDKSESTSKTFPGRPVAFVPGPGFEWRGEMRTANDEALTPTLAIHAAIAYEKHPCLVPYDELPQEQRAKDHLFGAVARALAFEAPELT